MSIRFASFNASLNRSSEGQLITDLSTPANAQAQAIAETIQRNNPDVVLINEFDYDAAGTAASLFQDNYLAVSQNGVDPVIYPYVYAAPSNTGVPSGLDLNNDGTVGGPDDAYGFGFFPGQFAFVIYSKYPIVEDQIRTFQEFRWADMPGALLPEDPTDADGDGSTASWYSPAELAVFRLSSKNHVDLPIEVDGEIIHVLASHPTPPVFDGPEDRNGRRNYDEIRFWADYINGADYIYDDNGTLGGLEAGAKFVIMGDQNSDPFDGDSIPGSAQLLLDNPLVNTSVTPSSEGGVDAAERQGLDNLNHQGNPAFDTADFGETPFGPGNLRADYVLPSRNLNITDAGVFWLPDEDPLFARLIGDFPFPTSDHRLVYVDVAEPATVNGRRTVTDLEFLGEVTFPTGLDFDGTTVGGLSGLVYDPAKGVYYALSDDRTDARFYTLTIDLSDGSLAGGDIAFTQVTALLNAEGEPFAPLSLDPEGIALTPDGTLYIASEGDANALIAPFVNEFSLTGQQLAALPVSAKFLPQADQSSGIRNNLAFESLTISPDGQFLYTATENALFQDGPAANLETGSLSRIVKYDLATGTAVQEVVYEVDEVPVAPNPSGSFSTNGLVELLATDNNGSFLALERAFSNGVGNTVKLYEVRSQGALDVATVFDLFREDEVEVDDELLPPGPFAIDPAVSKRELLDIEADLGITPDNLEALAFGPTLPDGRQTLLIASDNNFSGTQVTQFLAFALDLDTIPAVPSVLETPYTLDDDSFLEQEPLNILLVNDDGFEADGIAAMYDALVAAGHNVTFVAPRDPQSGQGTRINVDKIFQPTEVVEFEPNKWYVDGTPVVTTLAALDFILEETPDLVISGINEGENVGANIAISSGTVSAAITALQAGIPAIAISAGTARNPDFSINEAALEAAYEFSADYVVDLVGQLINSRPADGALLPEGVGLNVNVPALIENIEGTALTRLDETGTFDLFVGELAPGIPGLLFNPSAPITPDAITVPDSEGQNFLAGFVTITPIDGDWTASNNERQRLSDRVAAAPEDAVATPLNILLTNDDGFDAPGIEALYATLTAAGHTVTLVGPEEQQSGTGTALDTDKIFQPLDIVNPEANQWYVNAGVRTTTWAGLDFVLDGVAPDLVISGINEGENIGPGGAVSSGTVSAAVTALLRDVPAIAVSAGIDFTDPSGAGTEAAYAIGATFIADLIAKLQATQGNDVAILPEGLGLSVNIPVRFPEGVAGIQGVAFTNESDIAPFVIDFGPVPGGAGLRFVPFELPAGEAVDPLSEGAQFLSGFITVLPLDGDWTTPAAGQEQVADRLEQPVPELLGDSDDPAIWINPTNPDNSLVLVTLKDGGAAVLNLQGELLQPILPADYGDIRFNNVDLVYNFALGGETVDLAVFSDRENDTLAIYRIDPATQQLTDITAAGILETIFGVDDGEATAYGLATYVSPDTGKAYAFATQASGNLVAQLELVDNGDGTVNAHLVRTIELPVPTGEVEDSQSEGLVIDQELGFLYVALENEVGILKFDAEPDGGSDFTLVQAIDADFLEPDLEGLSIYYGAGGSGYLIASSQGNNSFAVFDRLGDNEYLGSFTVGDTGLIDQVNESDGLDVTNVALGSAFPNGLLIVQDGANDPQNPLEDDEQLENNSTNFKFVDWAAVANALGLDIDTTSYDPRNPVAVDTLPNGVASGDVTQDSVVLWTRSLVGGEVTFEYSTDPTFGAIAGTVTATVTDQDVPVKVEVAGLTAGTDYYYRVTDAAGNSKVGQFATAAPLGERAGLRFGVSGDWRGELAPYPAISNADEADLAFFLEHGDTIYADYASPAVPKPQAETLAEYRAKHAEVYSDRFGSNTWEDLRSATAVYATIDDHEVINDFSGGDTIGNDPRLLDAFPDDDPTALVNDSTLFDNGLQAFQEYNPIRDEFYGETGSDRTANERKLYRFNTFGSDAATFVLDTRSFRDTPLVAPDITNPTDIGRFLLESATLDRQFLGEVQLADLKADLLTAEENGITWKFVMVPEPIQELGIYNVDAFEGYAKERTEILKFVEANDIDNVVFIAADIHGTFVNNLTYTDVVGGPRIATDVWEITTGSVAFDAPFGQTVVDFATAAGLITPGQRFLYDLLPIAPDLDDFPNDKDDFLKFAFQTIAIGPGGYDPLGLNNNLTEESGLIGSFDVEAELLQGDYVAAHTYGWTQFDIDPITQELTVTTYGIEPYSEAELLADPQAILDRTPTIVSQFAVAPSFDPIAELIDLTGFTGEVTLNVTASRDAGYDNILKFYATDAQGRVQGLLPGAIGYEEAARASLLDAELYVLNQQTLDDTITLAGGTYYAPALLIDGDLQDLATLGDNAMGISRIQRQDTVWRFEDWTDNDFNDLVLTLNSVEAVTA